MKIGNLENGMRHVNIEGKIVNMNGYMLVVDDGTGMTFVRYRYRNLMDQVSKGNTVNISGCRAVRYSGILQLIMNPKGRISLRGAR